MMEKILDIRKEHFPAITAYEKVTIYYYLLNLHRSFFIMYRITYRKYGGSFIVTCTWKGNINHDKHELPYLNVYELIWYHLLLVVRLQLMLLFMYVTAIGYFPCTGAHTSYLYLQYIYCVKVGPFHNPSIQPDLPTQYMPQHEHKFLIFSPLLPLGRLWLIH